MPAGPADLKAVVGDSVVTLSWTPVAGHRYRVERADGWNNEFKRIGDGLDAGGYVDKGLANGRAYRYRLVADGAASAKTTEPVVAFSEAALPAVVMGGVIAGDGRVVLSWEPAPDAITYKVFRSDSADGDFKPIGLPVAGQEFVDESAVNGKAFYYKVAPQRRGPLGPLSAVASARPDAAMLGAEWHSTDIGSVGKRGSASIHPQSGVVTVSGSGDNVWGKKDSLQYVWQKLSGNGTITVHVLNFDNTSDFALAGVMVRESLKIDSAMALLAVTPGKGCGLVHRPTNGSDCVWAGGAGHPWLRLVRDGSGITAMVSKDGANWSVHAKATVALPEEVMIGLAVSSHHNGRLDKVLYDNVKVEPGK